MLGMGLKIGGAISKTAESILGMFVLIFHAESKYDNENLNFKNLLKQSEKKNDSWLSSTLSRDGLSIEIAFGIKER